MILFQNESAFTFTSSGVTDRGSVRDHNEDAFVCLDKQRMWVVADGAGGHAAGEVASNMIVDQLAIVKRPRFMGDFLHVIETCLNVVNEELITLSGGAATSKIIGSTVTVLVQHRNQMVCLWAGDSRIYLLRNNVLGALTHDHNRVDEFVDSGFTQEEAEKYPQAQHLTHAVGVESPLYLEKMTQECLADDVFLMCSDGLYNAVSHDAMRDILAKPNVSVKSCARQLIKTALDNGARDNVTALLVNVSSTE